MKKLTAFLFAGFLFCGCSDDAGPDSEILIAQVLERMEENALVIDNAFGETTERLNEIALVSWPAERADFIEFNLEVAEDAFQEAVEMSRQPLGIGQEVTFTYTVANTSSYVFKEQLELIPAGLEGPNPGSGVIDLLSQELDATLNRDIHKTEILIESISFSQSVGADDLPTEFVSFNYGRLGLLKQELEDLVMTHTDIETLDEAITELTLEDPDIRLLLGAIKPVLLTMDALNANNTYKGLSQVTVGTLSLLERKEWDKNMRHAALLAAIRFLISEDFEPATEDHLSIGLQHAMFQGVIALSSATQYDKK